MRMQAYGGPAQPSPLLGEALNAGFRYLEVKCAGCDTCNTVDLTTLRRPKENADLATGALHAMPAVLGRARLSLQAWAPGSAATDQHHDGGRWRVLVSWRAAWPTLDRTRARIGLIAALMVMGLLWRRARMT